MWDPNTCLSCTSPVHDSSLMQVGEPLQLEAEAELEQVGEPVQLESVVELAAGVGAGGFPGGGGIGAGRGAVAGVRAGVGVIAGGGAARHHNFIVRV
ncbi:hypothetical protein CDAR_275401 [Caerostris darwini]|uniref:Uncharacterized protein n=1 Tax=Caerostris darwini TaxID=1538125 RepID=A0AAV4UMQ7_9ARAC|nr:hypothetical protein CDAR_275401 [Caerostris darwini]